MADPVSSSRCFEPDRELLDHIESRIKEEKSPFSIVNIEKARYLSSLTNIDVLILEKAIEEVLIAFEENRKPSLKRVASAAGISLSHLRQKFKRNTNVHKAYTLSIATSKISKSEYFYELRLALQDAKTKHSGSIRKELINMMGRASQVYDDEAAQTSIKVFKASADVINKLIDAGTKPMPEKAPKPKKQPEFESSDIDVNLKPEHRN